MIKVIRTYTRPNIDTAWHWEVIQTTCFIKYDVDGQRIGQTADFSSDGLQTTFIAIWIDQASYDLATQDPEVLAYWEERATYNDSHGITMTPATIEPVEV